MAASLVLTALSGIPLIEPGDDLAARVLDGYSREGLSPRDDDVLVVAQKIVSKAEGRYASLSAVQPGPQALAIAQEIDKDARLVELILQDSSEILRQRRGLLIVQHVLGQVQANAGIDRSNIASDDSREPRVLLLPADPDASARALREAIRLRTAADVAVIVNDSAGRAWRNGVVGFALGCAGIEPMRDMVGQPDLFGRALKITQIAVADELAAAGSLLMGQANEGRPVVLARGMKFPRGERAGVTARSLVRPRHEDLFR